MRPQRIPPGPGQESVWDYPRPPRIEPVSETLKVVLNGITIAETDRSYRVLETSHPPVYYFPPEDVNLEYLQETGRKTWCEFKGWCRYFSLKMEGVESAIAAWSYDQVTPGFEAIQNYISFYAQPMSCYVGDELVQPQAGDYYGGWVTKNIVGPFKGGPGTMGW
ncbi:DUF427 domain-containing protein [Oxynema sp. CENA135]|uniref:DUF427 domain-containing protein n=1 Tax=Oxynema sp. CENA135 TaxID=984206 RepID=UPI001909BE1B|nr:DUF427 domain-containing protein [Oxynema sp. CENA135]MBK4732226.1 DUF427 domain-containing protein [Oxynema sp. CENA135]